MGSIRPCKPVLLLVAAFGSSEEALALGKERAEKRFGPIAKESATYRFEDFTRYYENEMGASLPKRFWVFENLVDPSELASIKIETNSWEEEIGARLYGEGKATTPRPLNLDPGYIELGKLILASTKDHAHRIYLRDGIFAETTLMYAQKRWRALPWSYADYQNPKNQDFFTECRAYLRERLKERGL
ncbi:MAG: DUF4416 family protein [Thermoguttaceae bacterium]|nr:DUF4416 family protein [Thermoguttaceae bacterium]